MNENMNLDDLMGGKRPRSTTTIDLTGSQATVNGEKIEPIKNPTIKAVPVVSGPVDTNNLRPVDIDRILPKREPAPNPIETKLMDDLDAAVDREIENITKLHEDIAAKQEEEYEAAELEREEQELSKDDEFALNGTVSADDYIDENKNDDDEDDDIIDTIKNNDRTVAYDDHDVKNDNKTFEKPKINILDNIDDDDLFDDAADEKNENNNNDAETDTLLEELKNQIKQRVEPIKKSFDLSKFTISQKAVSAQKVMKLAVQVHQNVADWVLPSAGRSISVSGLSGPEILKLNPENSNRNRQNTFRDMYRVIYDHIVDGNKPDFEVWLKQTRFVDMQHIYFALYMATFGGSNFLNYTCPKCEKVFIKDVDFKDMVMYADDETKEKINCMLKQDTTSHSSDSYNVELIQVSNSYVLGIKTPSIWNVIMETASLSEKFLDKYSDLIDMVSYIDSAYLIDEQNGMLIPVNTKPDPNDMAKTAARRIKAMYDIIATLNSEEFYALRSKINEHDEFATSKISYKIPETICPHCATKVPENRNVTPDNMLFMRHQLAAIANM